MVIKRIAAMKTPARFPLFAVFIFSATVLQCSCHAESRTWTSADGKTLEAEYVSGSEKEVTLRRESDGRRFTLSLEKLSEDDRAFVKAMLTDAKRPAEIEAGPYFPKFSGDWEKMVFDGKLPYQMYASGKMKASGSYPVAIYLHGVGQKGDDNEQQMGGDVRMFANPDFYKKRECIVIVPQCSTDSSWKGDPGNNLIALVKDLTAKAPVDRNRIYLTGYSMGGFGTWALLAQEPDLFAAGVPVAGGASPQIADKIKDIPIWAFHGEKDPTVKVEQSRQIVDALKAVDGKIKYTEMPGADHGISYKVFADEEMHEWLFEQMKKPN